MLPFPIRHANLSARPAPNTINPLMSVRHMCLLSLVRHRAVPLGASGAAASAWRLTPRPPDKASACETGSSGVG